MLGNILKLVRISNNMDVNTVSKSIYLKKSLIEDIETGKVKIYLGTLNKFAEFYQISINKLLILSDFQEHFKVPDEQIINDIIKYYSCIKIQQNKQKIKQK